MRTPRRHYCLSALLGMLCALAFIHYISFSFIDAKAAEDTTAESHTLPFHSLRPGHKAYLCHLEGGTAAFELTLREGSARSVSINKVTGNWQEDMDNFDTNRITPSTTLEKNFEANLKPGFPFYFEVKGSGDWYVVNNSQNDAHFYITRVSSAAAITVTDNQ